MQITAKRRISFLLAALMLVSILPLSTATPVSAMSTITIAEGQSYEFINLTDERQRLSLVASPGLLNHITIDENGDANGASGRGPIDRIPQNSLVIDPGCSQIITAEESLRGLEIKYNSSLIEARESSHPAFLRAHLSTLGAYKFTNINDRAEHVGWTNKEEGSMSYIVYDENGDQVDSRNISSLMNHSTPGQVLEPGYSIVLEVHEANRPVVAMANYMAFVGEWVVEPFALPAGYSLADKEVIKFQAGDSYEFVNLTDKRQSIQRIIGYGRVWNLGFVGQGHSVSQGSGPFDKSPATAFSIDAGGRLILSLEEEESLAFMEVAVASEDVQVNRLGYPAMLEIALRPGDSYEFTNQSAYRERVGFQRLEGNVSYTVYDVDGSVLESKSRVPIIPDLPPGISIQPGQSIKVSLHDSRRPLIAYGNYEAFTGNLPSWTPPVEETDDKIKEEELIEPIYEEIDASSQLALPLNQLEGVRDQATALESLDKATEKLTNEQKTDSTAIDLVSLFVEEVVAQAATSTTDADKITINQSQVQALSQRAQEAKSASEAKLTAQGLASQRDLQTNVKFKTSASKALTITIDPSTAQALTDNIKIETPNYGLSLSAETIRNNASDSPLTITIEEVDPDLVALAETKGQKVRATSLQKSYKISFDKEIKDNIKISLPPLAGDPNYQAITNALGTAIGGKYNPVTKALEVKVRESGIYTVSYKEKNFTDIAGKSDQMQEAIKILAAKGIINGTSATTFSPDNTITRAEIAALITRTLSKLDDQPSGNFEDVSPDDWYYGVAYAAQKYGIMNGTSETTFAPGQVIPKDQILAVAARVLRNEMKYKDSTNPGEILAVYDDQADIADWFLADLALATREGLVSPGVDSKLNPTTSMTRGETAIILYRMFNKIW